MEEANLKRLHALWFQLYDIWERVKKCIFFFVYVDSKRSLITGRGRVQGEMNRWSADFYGSRIKTTLDDIIMVVDIDPHAYIWTHRICNTERYLKVNSGLWVIMIFQCMLKLSQIIYIWGFPGVLAGKESTCNVGDLGLIPGLGRSLGEGNGYPLQYSGLENSMDSSMGSQRVGHDWVTLTPSENIYDFVEWHW